MSYELINTSAPRGLLPGSRGFTTVAMTADTPPPLIQMCDGLSNYTHVFGLESGSYADNPPSFSHFHIRLGSRSLSVLSRVAAHAPDYSGRTNRIAHHVVLDTGGSDRLGAAGPAATLEAIRFLKQWEGDPRELPPASVPVPPGPARMPSAFIAKHWQELFGAPDLAACLAGAWMAAPNRPTFLIVPPRDPRRERMVALIGDAISLLPPEMRWGVTFSTYLSIDPPGGDCVCRGLLPDSAAERQARRLPDALIINFESGTREGGAYGSDMANALIPAAKGLTLPPWAIQAAAPVQAHKVPVARLASSVEKTAVQVSPVLRTVSTPGRPIPNYDSAKGRPPKRDRTVMIAAMVCAAAVAALLVVLSFPTKPKSSGLEKIGINASTEQANTNCELSAVVPQSSTSDIPMTTGLASQAEAGSALPLPTNDVLGGATARKPDTVKPPAPPATEANRVISYSVRSSLPHTPTNGMQTKAVLASGEETVFTWKTPSGWENTSKWEVGSATGGMTYTAPRNNKPATWMFTSSMLIESPTEHLILYDSTIPFMAIRHEWCPDGNKPNEQAEVIIFARPKLQMFLNWLFDNVKAPVTLSEDLRLDKHESIEKAQKRKLNISRAPDLDRKARAEESKWWKARLIEATNVKSRILELRNVKLRDVDLKDANAALNILSNFVAFAKDYTEHTKQHQREWTDQKKQAEEMLVEYDKRMNAFEKIKSKNKTNKKNTLDEDIDIKQKSERRDLVDKVQSNVDFKNRLQDIIDAAPERVGESGPRQWPSSFDLNFILPGGETICFRVTAEGGISQR